MASLSNVYLSCWSNKASLSWQNRPRLSRLKLLSEGKFVWFPTGYGKSLCYPLLLFVMDYKLGRIYARTNAALVRQKRPRKSSLKSLLLFPVPNHAQIQSIPGTRLSSLLRNHQVITSCPCAVLLMQLGLACIIAVNPSCTSK